MIQVIPRIWPLVGYGLAGGFVPFNAGNPPIYSAAYGAMATPMPFATTVRNLMIYSQDPTRTEPITVTVMKNGVATALTGTILVSENGPIVISGIDVSFAQLDDICYRTSMPNSTSGNTIAVCCDVEGAGNVFGVTALSGTPVINNGSNSGAFGNGFWGQVFIPPTYVQSTSYSICATDGDVTTLALKSFAGPVLVGSWIGLLALNGVLQDGSGGTVDTRCTMGIGEDTKVATFTLPVVKGDHVEVALYPTASMAGPANWVACGIGFVPTSAGYFMMTGGSNDTVADPGYLWIHNWQNSNFNELEAETPVSATGIVVRGLYIESAVSGGSGSVTFTTRRSQTSTSVVVTLTGLQTSGLIENQVEPYVSGDSINLKVEGSGGGGPSKVYWGLEATTASAPPPDTGTLVVVKRLVDATDPDPEFNIEVGGGLSPASITLSQDESQIYTDVPIDASYTVSEPSPPIGWTLVSIVTSNGSPSNNITLTDGETVTVTVTNSNHPATYAIRRLRRAPHLSSEQFWQFFSQFQLDLQAGVGLVTGQGSNPQLMLRMSKDGGFTWGNEMWVSAGKIGEYNRRAIWRRLGRGRDVVFEVTMSDPVLWVLLDAYLQAEKGTS